MSCAVLLLQEAPHFLSIKTVASVHLISPLLFFLSPLPAATTDNNMEVAEGDTTGDTEEKDEDEDNYEDDYEDEEEEEEDSEEDEDEDDFDDAELDEYLNQEAQVSGVWCLLFADYYYYCILCCR